MTDKTANNDEVIESVEELIELEEEGTGPEESLTQLRARCSAAKIEVITRTYDDASATFTSIAMPSGREKRLVGATGERLERLLAVDFENYVFLQGFEAICNYSEGTIEVGLRGLPAGQYTLMRQLGMVSEEGEKGEFILAPPEGSENKPIYCIGSSSKEYFALAQTPGPVTRSTLTLT